MDQKHHKYGVLQPGTTKYNDHKFYLSKNRSKKTGRHKPKVTLPDLLPCSMNVKPKRPSQVFGTPVTKKRLKADGKRRKRSFATSHLSVNENPAQLSNFKKRLFSQENSPSKITKVQKAPDKSFYNQKVLIPLDRIVHER